MGRSRRGGQWDPSGLSGRGPGSRLADTADRAAGTEEDRDSAGMAVDTAGKDPADRDPAGNDPADGDPADRGPAGNDPADGDLAGRDPAGNDPADGDPASRDLAGNDPSGKDPAGRHQVACKAVYRYSYFRSFAEARILGNLPQHLMHVPAKG